jgi:alpha-amylase
MNIQLKKAKDMRSICFYFQVHQPFRLRSYRFFDIGENHFYFDEHRNRYIIRRVAGKCYLPMNNLLLGLIKEYGPDFRVSFSLSGIVIEQFSLYAPEVLESFQELAATGQVEFLAETYAHSLASIQENSDEFRKQVELHRGMIKKYFGLEPETFRNTELIYSNEIGERVHDMGFKTMLTEGAKHVLGWKSPNYMYCNAINPKLKLLLKNFQLSDDVAFRFSERSWEGWPLTADKFVKWLNEIEPAEETVNLFMDYETFGEHQWAETGIFDFMKALPGHVLKDSGFRFRTPAQLSDMLQPKAAYDVAKTISWADEERDLTAWLGNDLQKDAFKKVYEIEDTVLGMTDEGLMREWRLLQTSDHFYYMCTKWFSDGDVHKYFNPYNSPYEAYINYMNVLSDFLIRLRGKGGEAKDDALFAADEPLAGTEETDAVQPEKPKKPIASKTQKPSARSKATKKTAGHKTAGKTVTAPEMDIILTASDTALRKALRGIDAFTVGVALHGTTQSIRNRVLQNLGVRVLDRFRNMVFDAGELHPREIERCRKKLLKELAR